MTSAENSISEPSNMNIFWGRIPPHSPTRVVPSALAIMPFRYKNLATALYSIINLSNYLGLSVKQHQNPCSGPPPVYQVFEYGLDFPLKETLSISQSGPIRLKGNAFPVIR